MNPRPRLSAFALLVLLVAVALYTVGVQPDNVLITEAFPAGLLAGSLLLVHRHRRPVLVVVAALLVAGVYFVLGRDLPLAIGWGVAAALGAWVCTEVLTGRGARRAALINQDDLRSFIVAGFAGAVTAATVTAVVAEVTGYASWWMTALGVGVAHFATYLTLMPHFMGRPRFPGVAAKPERIVQWSAPSSPPSSASSRMTSGLRWSSSCCRCWGGRLCGPRCARPSSSCS